jgi:DNA-directed RNA polymerase specialized sigma24 family protein
VLESGERGDGIRQESFMSSPGSVTVWIEHLRAGDAAAAEHLWEGYYRRLVGLARQKFLGRPRAAADEEDVALSAFHSFCRGVDQGRFPRLADRDDLWQLLVLLTARKAASLVRDETRKKRGGGMVLHASALADEDSLLAEFIGTEPTPDFAAQVAEECRRLLDGLDADLRAVAQAKMEGYTNEEIARQQGCVVRTVERRLRIIRGLWQEGTAP